MPTEDELKAAVMLERERCAKIAEEFYDNSVITEGWLPPLQKKIAAAIRNPS